MARELRITIDARQWGITGIGRYVQELCTYLAQIPCGPELQLLGAPSLAQQITGVRVLGYRAKMYSLTEQLLGGLSMRQGEKPNLYHFPHYNVPAAPPRPFVVTVHDLIHFRFANQLSRWKVVLAKQMLKRCAKLASRVICISESTGNDLVEMFPDIAEKSVVIPQAVSSFFRPCDTQEISQFKSGLGLNEYLLYVGSDRPHKGYQTALATFVALRETRPDLDLVCVGQFAKIVVAPGVRHLGYVGDEQLRRLYSGATCLLFSSQYEGFGLPILEAMACACPVVCGRGSSLNEVCGQAAEQTDAGNPILLAKSINLLLLDHAKRQEYIRRGLARASIYSWRQVAAATLAVYREVAGLQGS